MKNLRKSPFFSIIIWFLLCLQALPAFGSNKTVPSCLSPAASLSLQSVQQSFQTKNPVPGIAENSIYKAESNQLKQQEQMAMQTAEQFAEEMRASGNPIQKELRKSGVFKTEYGDFSFDISGWPSLRTSRDKKNLYFRSGGVLVYNLWLENEAKAFLPSPSGRPAILVPMQSTLTPIEDLHDQHLHQLWTSSLLIAMQLAGEESFKDKDVAIAGIGNGVDTILSLQLGASKTYLFDYNLNLSKMFKQTLPYNTITSNATVNTKNIGKSFYDLSGYEPVKIDILLANLPALGTKFLSEFLQFFKPKNESILVILSGANYSMLNDSEKNTIKIMEKFKKSSQVIKIDYNDGLTAIDDDPLTYIYEFEAQVWQSKEFLDAVLAAKEAEPDLPQAERIPAPENTSSPVLQSI
jgi:hypothetical protein